MNKATFLYAILALSAGTLAQAAPANLSLKLENWNQGATKAILGVTGLPDVVTSEVSAKGEVSLALPTPKADAKGNYLVAGMTDPDSTLQNLFMLTCPASVGKLKASEGKMPIFVGDITGYVKGKKGFISLSSRMLNSALPEDKGSDGVIANVLYVPRAATLQGEIKDCGKDAYAKALKTNLKLAAGWNQLVWTSKFDSNMQMSLTVRAVPLSSALLYNALGDTVLPKAMPDAFATVAKTLK